MNQVELDSLLKPLTIKDLRVQCRARGLSPAGGLETLRERLKEQMLETKDFSLKTEAGEDMVVAEVVAGQSSKDVAAGRGQNNYVRPAGQQNVGNFITDRPSSRVLAAPGGASQIVFGDAEPAKGNNNNYARPAGQQNVGNFLTDKPSSKVSAPPGGASQIIFG